MYKEISDLVGKTLTSIDQKRDEIIFNCDNGTKYRMFHEQDCCEDVAIEDVCGDWDILIGNPIVKAEESTNCGESEWGTTTWTFYHIATVKGVVTIRWLGESNGYYSESVDFALIEKGQDNE